MDIAITKQVQSGATVCYELTCGKYVMAFAVARTHLTTLVDNAAHRAWRRGGKTFHGTDRFDQAIAAYKSPECRAMIEHIRAETAKAIA